MGGTKSEAICRKSFKVRENTSLLCPPERLVQTHKLSMVIEAMICALQRMCESRLERAKFRCGVYEPPSRMGGPCLGRRNVGADQNCSSRGLVKVDSTCTGT